MGERFEVRAGSGPYPVEIGNGLLAETGSRVGEFVPARRALLALDANIAATHGAVVEASLRAVGIEPEVIELVASEKAKTLETVRVLYDAMLAARLERGSPVVAVGGGIVGDTAGFAAATYLRGVPLVQVPTTLLAMVDASIGGKTGVNVPLHGGALGKNLVGAFWPPRLVLADPQVLATLAPRELRCGLAECVKHAIIADAELLAAIERDADAILSLDDAVVTPFIARSARIKAAVVADDEREAGRRALLNLGHTFAHAIEARVGNGLLHGEAVSVGLVAAATAAVALGRLDTEERDRIVDVLERVGLPVRLDTPADPDVLVDIMQYDKKVAGGRVRLVLPEGIGSATIVDDAPAEVVRGAWEAVGATGARG